MFILTACGALIDTTMNVSDTGAGERVMVLSLDESDMSSLTGGAAAADDSIRRHLPESLSYTGLRESSDGAITATFTLKFDSPSDYQQKATVLLQSGTYEEADIEFSVSDSTLVQGITLRESHTSGDLMQWMFDGLLADGVVAEDNASSMYELGTSVLAFGGKRTEQSGAFDFEDTENRGFDSVVMQTQIQDPANITRTITYTVDENRYASNKDLLSRFISESTPDGAVVETPANGIWTMTFSGDPEAVTSSTGRALGGSAAKFALDPVESPDDPASTVLAVTDLASCDAVCASYSPIPDTLTAASGYTPERLEVDTSVPSENTLTYAPPIESVAASFHFGLNGSVNANVDFVVPQSSVDAVNDGFALLFDPGQVGTLSTTQDGENTTYTVSITGENAEAFTANYSQWAMDSFVTGETDDEGLFLRSTGYSISPALYSLTGSHPVTGGVSSEIILPFGQWVTNAGDGTEQAFGLGGARVSASGLDSSFTVQSTGPAIGGLVAAAVFLAVVAAGALLLIRHRNAVTAWLQAARTEGEAASRGLLHLDTGFPGQTPGTAGPSLLELPMEDRPRTATPSLLDMRAPGHAARQSMGGSILEIPEADSEVAGKVSLLDLEPVAIPGDRPSLLN